jgi:hypothetical protein
MDVQSIDAGSVHLIWLDARTLAGAIAPSATPPAPRPVIVQSDSGIHCIAIESRSQRDFKIYFIFKTSSRHAADRFPSLRNDDPTPDLLFYFSFRPMQFGQKYFYKNLKIFGSVLNAQQGARPFSGC